MRPPGRYVRQDPCGGAEAWLCDQPDLRLGWASRGIDHGPGAGMELLQVPCPGADAGCQHPVTRIHTDPWWQVTDATGGQVLDHGPLWMPLTRVDNVFQHQFDACM
jgi:hypothetical protein